MLARSGVLLGDVERADGDGTKTDETQETRTAGKIDVSSWNRLFETAFVSSGKQWRKAGKKTTYLTFVPYLVQLYETWLKNGRNKWL